MEVILLDITLIVVIVMVAVFIICGTIAGNYSAKANLKDNDEISKYSNK